MLVVLFKTPDEDADVDPYATTLEKHNLEPFFIPVLQHDSVNADQLQKTLLEGSAGKYGGVIVTSSRAAEMWIRAAINITNGEDGT